MYLEDLARNLRRIDVAKLFIDSIRDPGSYILAEAADMNVQQLEDAQYSDGSWTGEYSSYSEEYRKAKGLPYSKGIIFRDEGDFHAGFYAEAESDGALFLYSSDPKAEELEDTWSVDIFGLTPKNKAELSREYILPTLLENIRNAIKA